MIGYVRFRFICYCFLTVSAKWFPKWTKKSADFKSNGAFHKPISSYK